MKLLKGLTKPQKIRAGEGIYSRNFQDSRPEEVLCTNRATLYPE
ncbi:MAG: hypothetical protein PWP37_1091 [Thermotogota bacterium]|nr:hypothetical protein [Thermotogota bacterium]MDK2864899.1 hypothetical protein [Thermotogota bacterium]